ncbi:MAG: restriction endonuclease subunit S [Bacteroidota bacterium]
MKLERLGNYIKQIRGLSYKPNEIHDEYQEGRIAILKANNIQDNVLDDTDLIYIDKSKTKTEQKIKKGDILIAASSGSKEIVGKNIYFRNDYEAVFGAFCKVVRINEKVNSEFISHFFKTPIYKNHIRNSIQGANINNLKNEHIDELKLAIPSLEEQKHIAVVLSKAEALIAERKQSIQLLDEYLKSTFLEMFGDPEKNPKNFPFTELQKLCSVIVDCPHSTPVKANEVTNYPCIRTSELTNGYITWDSMQYLDEDEYIKRTQRLIPEAGDIVYGREGTYGEAIRIPNTHKFSLGQRTMLFRPDYKKTDSIFLWAMVRSEFVYKQAKKKNSGSTVGHVNVKDIKQFKVYNPPLKLQTQFAQIVEKTEALKAQYKAHLQELEQLYGALSQRAFRGEMRAVGI